MCDKAGIYLWYNLKTGKSYIGQASNLHVRKLQFLDRNLYSYAGSYINRARKKYNNSDWQYKVLKKCSLEAKYCSTRECEEVTGYKHTNIASACRGKYHKSGHKVYGYLWFYENKGNLDV